MDYTGFVRRYYVSMMARLNKPGSYNGATAILNYPLGISSENTHLAEAAFDGLPGFSLNINAPTAEYEEFLDYYGKAMPDMAPLFLPKGALRSLYSATVMDDGDDGERIDLYIDIALDALKRMGVIEHHGEEIQ